MRKLVGVLCVLLVGHSAANGQAKEQEEAVQRRMAARSIGGPHHATTYASRLTQFGSCRTDSVRLSVTSCEPGFESLRGFDSNSGGGTLMVASEAGCRDGPQRSAH